MYNKIITLLKLTCFAMYATSEQSISKLKNLEDFQSTGLIRCEDLLSSNYSNLMFSYLTLDGV